MDWFLEKKGPMGVLVGAGSECPICGRPLLETDRVFNFTYACLSDRRFESVDDNAVQKNVWKIVHCGSHS